MPIYHPRLITVDLDETKRYAGLGSKANFSAALLTEACTQAQLLATPKGVWQVYVYDQDSHTIMSPNPLSLTAESIIKHLSGAVEVAVMAVTIGQPLEQEVSNLFSRDQYTLGLLLDAAGTTAVEAVCDAVCSVISGQAARTGLTAGRRFSPGYGGWPVDIQPEILALASGATIDLSVTDTKMLVPRKSVTAVIGLYPYHQALSLPHQQELSCDKCGQPGCHARKETDR
ncbi:hypothetical protein [Sporomusa malonica]|uniref:Vitamin B12 dependent methionine synthase, activation domain n=1 Tax=Sporomusa malonica TaxID=112901 RepID=A0A1W2D1Q9_9FIRM|nr:hypothetical protein [Sporomusa malonica]SMC91507.1 hypothetical protein SAMN04488500_11336 [Sporomusa malonica]